ncbi:hypothetical protein CBL_01535 [Carabus blaptoides fortunei]
MKVFQVILVLLLSVMTICCYAQNNNDRSKCNPNFQYNDLVNAYNLLLRVKTGRVHAQTWLEKALESRISSLVNVLRLYSVRRPKINFVPPPLVNPYPYNYTAMQLRTQTNNSSPSSVIMSESIPFTTPLPDLSESDNETNPDPAPMSSSIPASIFFSISLLTEPKAIMQPPVVSIAKTDFEMNYPSTVSNSVGHIDSVQQVEQNATLAHRHFAEPPSNTSLVGSSSKKEYMRTFRGIHKPVIKRYHRNENGNGHGSIDASDSNISGIKRAYRVGRVEILRGSDNNVRRINTDNGYRYIPMY